MNLISIITPKLVFIFIIYIIMLDLNSIKTTKAPATKDLFVCSNGKFIINGKWVIVFEYTHTPDQEVVERIKAEIAEQEAIVNWFGEVVSDEEAKAINNISKLISELNRKLNWELTEKRIANYRCTWITDDNIKEWLSIAEDTINNSVWSVARATGLIMDWDVNDSGKYTWTWKKF